MIIAKNQLTLSRINDVASTTYYYLLQSSTASPPAKPTTANPGGNWKATEPAYTEGSTNSLYIVIKTTYTDNSFEYSNVSLSSSYEAAKVAYNKSVAAAATAQSAVDTVEEYISPIAEKSYTGINVTANSDPAAYLYFGSVKPDEYNTPWRVRYQVEARISTLTDAYQVSEVTISGMKNTYAFYRTYNAVSNTNYRPMYYHLLYALKEAGVNAGLGHLLGIGFHWSYNPHNTAYPRDVTIKILEAENCEVTLSDTMFLYANAPGTGSTNYQGRTTFDGSSQGRTGTGDRNETNHILNNFAGKTGVLGIWQTGLFMRDGAGRYQNICTDANGAVTRTTAATKKPNPNGFEIGSSIYFSPNNTYAANANISGSVYGSYGVIDSRYFLNTTLTAGSLTAYKDVYLVGEIDESDGLFYLDDVWWTQTPTTEGKVYVLLGACYDSTTSNCRVNLYEQNSWYIYDGSGLVEYTKHLADLAQAEAEAAYQQAYQAMPKFGSCSTAAGTAAKEVTGITNFTLTPGMRVAVLMTATNTANQPTLNINGTGAKPIVTSDGTRLTTANNKNRAWAENSLVTFVYDGTNWRIDDAQALTKIDEILTRDVVGTNGWINFDKGTFNFGQGKLVWDIPSGESSPKLSVAGEITADSGSIGGFTIDSTSIRSAALTSNASGSIGLSTADFTRTINGASRSGLRLAIGSNFGVSKTGVLYAGSVDISGKITADSGAVGGWSIGSTLLQKFTPETLTSGDQYNVFLQAPSSIDPASTRALGVQKRTYSGGTAGSWSNVFHIRYDGYIYAVGGGKLGGWTLQNGSNGSLYNGKSSLTASAAGVYIGSDGISLGTGSTFKVTSAGALTATKGTIGGWTLGESILQTTSTIDGQEYISFMQVPNGSSIVNVFGVRVGDDYPFYVTYDGNLHSEKLYASGGRIGGWTIASTLLRGETYAEDIVGGRSGKFHYRSFLQIPDGENSVYSFGVLNTDESDYVFGATYDGRVYSKLFYEDGVMLRNKYNGRMTIPSATGTVKSISSGETSQNLLASGVALTARHRYCLHYMVQWGVNATGRRWTSVSIGGSDVGIIASDYRLAMSTGVTICRGEYWIPAATSARTLQITGWQNSGSALTATVRYQLIDLGE